MGSEEPLLLCYNRGCGKEYKESENAFNSCRFHPGTPYFHDAYKGWTCCRKSVDFTEFLNMKGCATGFHSNEKPPEVEKKKEEINASTTEVCQPKYVPMERPSIDTPLIEMKTILSDSLREQTYNKETQSRENSQEKIAEVKVGVTQCVNKGCKTTYQGPATDAEVCKYHPGVPIFHEGLKYWSCCQKKTTEFDVFLKQEGCQTGSHVWIKQNEKTEDDEGSKIIKCREDWHQDGLHIIQVVYAGGKKFDPKKSFVKCNPVKLIVELFFPEENGFYRKEWILAGIIVPDASSVLMTPMKIEVKMKKAEPIKWSSLDVPCEKLQAIKLQEEEENKSVGVDPVDLSDL